MYCRNSLLMISGSSTTLSRKRNARKSLLLPPLLPLSHLPSSGPGGRSDATPLAPCRPLCGSDPLVSTDLAVDHLHQPLPPLLLRLLRLLLFLLPSGGKRSRHHQPPCLPRPAKTGTAHHMPGTNAPAPPASDNRSGRVPGRGRFCARGPPCFSWTSPSLALVAGFCSRGAPYCCALWCDAAAKAAARDTRSCLHHERSLRCLRRKAAPPCTVAVRKVTLARQHSLRPHSSLQSDPPQPCHSFSVLMAGVNPGLVPAHRALQAHLQPPEMHLRHNRAS